MSDLIPNQCDCPGWVRSYPSLKDIVFDAWLHGHTYSGDPVSYCPFCGKGLSQ
jgi:hypothetical protein